MANGFSSLVTHQVLSLSPVPHLFLLSSSYSDQLPFPPLVSSLPISNLFFKFFRIPPQSPSLLFVLSTRYHIPNHHLPQVTSIVLLHAKWVFFSSYTPQVFSSVTQVASFSCCIIDIVKTSTNFFSLFLLCFYNFPFSIIVVNSFLTFLPLPQRIVTQFLLFLPATHSPSSM